jgi:uncharacterized protein YggE
MNSKTLALTAPLAGLMLVPTAAIAAKATPPAEVILHIDASATVPPDQAKVTIALAGKGATEAEAKADLAARQKEFGDELSQMSIGGASVEHGEVVRDPSKLDPMAVEAAYAAEDAAYAAGDAAAEAAELAASAGRPSTGRTPKRKTGVQMAAKPIFVTAPTTITLTDLTKLDALRALGELNGTRSYQFQRGVRFATSNPEAARKAAREQALAKAKREADEYAASLGHKVVRIARVSNSSPPVSMGDIYGLFGMFDTMPERFMPSYYGATTSVSVAIDFVIAPN